MQHQSINESLPEWQYSVIVNLLTPAKLESEHASKDEAESGKTSGEENDVSFQWLDVNPSEIAFHQPLIKVETQQQGQWQTLKQGLVPITDEKHWYNPIPGQTQGSLHSAPFTVMP